ncbi:MAG: cytochrome c oxidase subunit II [Chloroflexota bacterium]
MKSNRLATVGIVGAVLIAIGVFVGATANVFPTQASADAGKVDTLFNIMLAIATIIFLIVEGGIIYSIIFFRHKKGDDTDGPPDHGNTALEVTWTAIPAVIVFVLTIYSYQVFADMQTPRKNETIINVVGQQFQWSFSYPYEPFPDLTADQNAIAQSNMVSNELHLPINRDMRVEIQSRDVMHGFYIPEFRIKQDAIPGKTTTARFTPTVKGEYAVVCTELCGQGHANMHNPVFVQDPADYDNFVSTLRTNARQAALDPRRADRGKQLIAQKYPCGSCHTLTDVGLKGNVGPNLDGVATRAANNADGRLTGEGAKDAAEYIRISIINPGVYLVPGFQNLMPKNFGDPTVMPEDDREAIVNYLLTQK